MDKIGKLDAQIAQLKRGLKQIKILNLQNEDVVFLLGFIGWIVEMKEKRLKRLKQAIFTDDTVNR